MRMKSETLEWPAGNLRGRRKEQAVSSWDKQHSSAPGNTSRTAIRARELFSKNGMEGCGETIGGSASTAEYAEGPGNKKPERLGGGDNGLPRVILQSTDL